MCWKPHPTNSFALQGHIMLQLPHEAQGLQVPCFNFVQARWLTSSCQALRDRIRTGYNRCAAATESRAKTTAQWVLWHKHGAQCLFTASHYLAWMGCCISTATMNTSLDINRTGLCCNGVIWVDREGGSKQQRRYPAWKRRNDTQLLQWLQSIMSWLASVHHYCFLVSGTRSKAMCQGLHTVSC